MYTTYIAFAKLRTSSVSTRAVSLSFGENDIKSVITDAKTDLDRNSFLRADDRA